MNLTEEAFEAMVLDFYEYMDLASRPSAPTRLNWHRKLSMYLESDVLLAFEKMKDTESFKPKNMPKAIKAALGVVWSDQGVNLKEWKDYGPCADCNGSGFFRIRYFHAEQNRFHVGIMFCGSCNNYLNLAADNAIRTSARYLTGMRATWKPGKASLRASVPAKGMGSVPKIQAMAKNLDNHPEHPKEETPIQGTGRHLTQAEKDKYIAMFDDNTKEAIAT